MSGFDRYAQTDKLGVGIAARTRRSSQRARVAWTAWVRAGQERLRFHAGDVGPRGAKLHPARRSRSARRSNSSSSSRMGGACTYPVSSGGRTRTDGPCCSSARSPRASTWDIRSDADSSGEPWHTPFSWSMTMKTSRDCSAGLVTRGYVALETGDPHEAIRIAKEQRIDLLLTDVIMPIMKGTELADRVEAVSPSTKVLLNVRLSDLGRRGVGPALHGQALQHRRSGPSRAGHARPAIILRAVTESSARLLVARPSAERARQHCPWAA